MIYTEQDIDEDALLLLTEEGLKEIIPKVGPRMKFLAKLKAFQTLNTISFVVAEEDNVRIFIQFW